MTSSEMLRRVALVRTDVSEELSASFIRVTKIGELGTTLATADLLLQTVIGKWQIRPLVREGSPQGRNSNCQTVTNSYSCLLGLGAV
jgi:hypothetical protein